MIPLEKEAWRWAQINREAKAFFDALPDPRKYELPSSLFFSGDDEVYKKIFEFIDVPCPPLSEIQTNNGEKNECAGSF